VDVDDDGVDAAAADDDDVTGCDLSLQSATVRVQCSLC